MEVPVPRAGRVASASSVPPVFARFREFSRAESARAGGRRQRSLGCSVLAGRCAPAAAPRLHRQACHPHSLNVGTKFVNQKIVHRSCR